MDPVFLCVYDYESEPCQGFYPFAVSSDVEGAKALCDGSGLGDRQGISVWTPDSPAPQTYKTIWIRRRRYDDPRGAWGPWVEKT
jgi:hypothetical protein